MKKHFYTTLVCLCACLFVQNTFAQITLKLQYLEGEEAWGIFAKPSQGMDPSDNLIPASGQITLVVPTNFKFGTQLNHAGQWTNNATVKSPQENPDMDYLSFGYLSNNPPIKLDAGEETLLFTLGKLGNCPDTLHLIDNEHDPFSQIPNSVGTNPGNNLSIFDAVKRIVYDVSGNYGMSMWNCDPALQVSSNEEVYDAEAFVVSPNPANSTTSVTMPFMEGDLQISNQLGKRVMQINGYQAGDQINISHLSEGLYSVVVQHNSILYSRKLLIQK
jgi:hypothetical protein